MNDWRKLARTKFPFGEIRGEGRWACVRRCGFGATRRWRISLHVDYDHAEKAASRECPLGCKGTWNHFVTSVAPPEPPAAPPVKPSEKAPPLFGLMKD
jgi:hypothetical protein